MGTSIPTEVAAGPFAHGKTAPYGLGHSDTERQRLIDQAVLMEDRTRRLLLDAGIAPGMRVLDVGCGVGDVSMIAASLVGPDGSVVGIDRDPRSLDWAGRRVSEAGLSNITFVNADLTSLELDDRFDAGIGRFVLMHVQDPTTIVKRVAAQLEPDGIVAFQESQFEFPLLSEPSEPIVLWQQWMDWVIEVSHRGGVETRMGLKLYGVFIEAGLPPPELRMEVPLFTADEHRAFGVAAEALRSLLPALEKLGIATADEVDVDSFAHRLEDEIAQKGAVCTSFALVSAWSRKRQGE